jgi:hypothetical protein
MPAGFIESDAEEAALGWLETLGILSGMDRRSRFGIDGGERGDQVSAIRFCSTGCIGALTRLYPGLPTAAVFDGYRRLLRVEAPNLLARNRGSLRSVDHRLNQRRRGWRPPRRARLARKLAAANTRPG